MIKLIKTTILSLYNSNISFNNKVKKKPIIDKILSYYGISLIIFTFFSIFFYNIISTFFMYSVFCKVYYFGFYFALLLKLFVALDELVLIKDLYISTGFTPFLMLKSTATAVKICATCAAGAGTVAGGYIILAGEYSGVPDSRGYVHKHSPVQSISEYAQGRIPLSEMKEGVLNPKSIAAKSADLADKKYELQDLKKAQQEAAFRNKRWF